MDIKVNIRLARMEDAKLILKIYNFSIKKNFFYSNKIVSYKDHKKWLKEKLKSNSKIYIGTIYNKKFGYVRFDEVKKKTYSTSIGNLPNYYGKGLGTILLKKCITKFIKKYKPVKIVSFVKKSNSRSIKCFKKNHFIKIKSYKKIGSIFGKFKKNKVIYFEINKLKKIHS